MDWNKINYDLIESVLVFIAEGGSMDMRLPDSGSILVFLPGKLHRCAEMETVFSVIFEGLTSNQTRIGGHC